MVDGKQDKVYPWWALSDAELRNFIAQRPGSNNSVKELLQLIYMDVNSWLEETVNESLPSISFKACV